MTTDTTTDKHVCLACKGEGIEHDCGWVNEDCPESCHVEHPVDQGEVLICTATDQAWLYCCECGWEKVSRWASDPDYVDYEYYCDAWQHGWGRCDCCDEWARDDDITYDDYDDQHYCNICWDECRGERTSTRPGESITRCWTCCSDQVHLHLLTEQFLCDHLAVEAAKTAPVQFAYEVRPAALAVAA